MRLFGSLATGATQATWIQPDKVVGRWEPRGGDCGCGLWLVSVTEIAVVRFSQEEPLFPLPLIELGGAALPAGATLVRNRGLLKLQMSAEASATQRRWEQDTSQPFEVLADCLCAGFFVPSNVYEVNSGLQYSADADGRLGMVVDAMVSVGFSRVEQSVGNNEIVYSTNVPVPANTQVTFAVPPFAKEVQVYQEPTLGGGAAAFWTMFYGDPTVSPLAIEMGTLPFLAGQRITAKLDLPNVTHIRTDQDASERFFTCRWTIRP